VRLSSLVGLALLLALFHTDFAPGKTPTTKSGSTPKPATPSRSTAHPSTKSSSGNHGSNSGTTKHSASAGSQHTNAAQLHTTTTSLASMAPAMQHNRAFMMHARFHELSMLMALHQQHHHWHHWVWGYWPLGNYGMAGNVVGVPSGDSLMVTNGVGQTRRVRLFGVAAPANGQFAAVSQQRLARLQGKFVHVHSVSSDPDGSTVAKVFHNGVYVNQEQIATGMAFNSLDHGLDQTLANAEQSAQEQGKGVWAESGDLALAN
jgi:endonuclease YncB( thermonuclease family)